MSWDVRVVPEAIITYFVRCSTCGLNEECESKTDAEVVRLNHVRDHNDLYDGDTMDLGYGLNPDPETRRQ